MRTALLILLGLVVGCSGLRHPFVPVGGDDPTMTLARQDADWRACKRLPITPPASALAGGFTLAMVLANIPILIAGGSFIPSPAFEEATRWEQDRQCMETKGWMFQDYPAALGPGDP